MRGSVEQAWPFSAERCGRGAGRAETEREVEAREEERGRVRENEGQRDRDRSLHEENTGKRREGQRG